jgi:general secretion pathway protein C
MNAPASLQGLPQLLNQEWAQKLIKHLPDLAPKILSAVLLVLIAWQTARFTWLLWPHKEQEINMAPLSKSFAQQTHHVNTQQIADAHLFGVAKADDLSGADAANAPPSNMTLVLAGTLATTDPTKGFAFIGESVTTAKFVKVGDMIAGTARLHSVYVDKVVLDRGGRLESVIMPRSNLGGASRPPVVAAAPATNPGQFAQDLRRLAQNNPSALAEVIRPQPVFSGGSQKGFRVYPGRNRQMFASLGLQPGDLVTSVNGTALDDPARANDIFSTLSTSDMVSVTVERNGQTQQLTLNTSQIHLPVEPEANRADEARVPPTTPTAGMPTAQ